ncbi:MAG: DnaJ domain-containing protein [Anaerolineae bacterium]
MSKKTVKDYYAVLGVPQTASLDEIRRAYRRQARANHPDLSTDPEAEERFKAINEAYEVLANSEKRRAYDYFTSGETEEAPADVSQEAASPSATPSSTVHAPASGPAEPFRERTPTSPMKNSEEKKRRIYPPTWAILLIVLGGCIIVAVSVGAVLSLRRNRPTGGAESVSVTKLMTFTSPPRIPEDLTVIQEDNTPVRTVAPSRLSVTDETFSVVPVLPEQGRWPLPDSAERLALWMHGTLINYVIGLPYATTTESLLAGLESGDRITLTLETGARLIFGSPQVKRVDANDSSPMAQDKPGLTLVLLGGEGPSRLVVKARYLPEDQLPFGEQTTAGLNVRVERAGILETAFPEDQSAWFFVVEYQITNTTGASVETTFFDLVLQDDQGRQYVLDDRATSRGEHGRLDPVLQPGATVLGSAGYVIPRDARSPLTWIFRVDPTSGDALRFVIEFKPPAPAPAQPDVELADAFLDTRRDVIVVSGTVYNDGESDLRVTEDLVAITSGQGESALVAATPLLPWTVPPGDYQDFELQFNAPDDTGTALLNVLGFSFEIEGLTP